MKPGKPRALKRPARTRSARTPSPDASARQLARRTKLRPRLAFVLGSGFQHAVSTMDVELRVPYRELPGFPLVGVSGHSGELLIGHLEGTPVLALSGRAHFYEGYPMSLVTFAVRTLATFGIRDLVLTNAAGGLNPSFRAGDFMLVTDHINLMGTNPLRGAPLPKLPHFVDLSNAYDADLSAMLVNAAETVKLELRSGVYLAVCGPSYETPAEIRAFRTLGADAVGMSTVPEVIVARQCGIRLAALSCITNLAAGLSNTTISHAEVLEIGARVKHLAGNLLRKFASIYACSEQIRNNEIVTRKRRF